MKTTSISHILLFTVINFVMATSVSNLAHAQTKRNRTVTDYGFEASTGSRSFLLESNVASINSQQLNQRGGSIGFSIGKDFWRINLTPLGFYNSNTNTKPSVKLIESEGHLNIYPLSFLIPKAARFPNIYLTGGVGRGKYKVDGSYVPQGQTSTCIFDAFSTNITSWNILGGAGIEYRIGHKSEFIILFAEIKKGLSMATSSNQEVFNNTTFKNNKMINIGLAIGFKQ